MSPPILKIPKPVFGLTQQHIDTLLGLIQKKAKESIGYPMIFDVCILNYIPIVVIAHNHSPLQIQDVCVDWLRNNVKPAMVPKLSLAGEMTHRAAQEEEAN